MFLITLLLWTGIFGLLLSSLIYISITCRRIDTGKYIFEFDMARLFQWVGLRRTQRRRQPVSSPTDVERWRTELERVLLVHLDSDTQRARTESKQIVELLVLVDELRVNPARFEEEMSLMDSLLEKMGLVRLGRVGRQEREYRRLLKRCRYQVLKLLAFMNESLHQSGQKYEEVPEVGGEKGMIVESESVYAFSILPLAQVSPVDAHGAFYVSSGTELHRRRTVL